MLDCIIRCLCGRRHGSLPALPCILCLGKLEGTLRFASAGASRHPNCARNNSLGYGIPTHYDRLLQQPTVIHAKGRLLHPRRCPFNALGPDNQRRCLSCHWNHRLHDGCPGRFLETGFCVLWILWSSSIMGKDVLAAMGGRIYQHPSASPSPPPQL